MTSRRRVAGTSPSPPRSGTTKSNPFKAVVTTATQFAEVSRKRTGPGWQQTGRVLKLTLDKRALTQRLSLIMSLLCEFEREVAVHFADAVESERLNSSYRRRPAPTDVLSFPAAEENLRLHRAGLPSSETRRLGDVCLCVPVCAVQAREHRCSLSAELERMLVHGLCHLRGFDHERSDAAHEVMDRLESSIRRAVVASYGKPAWAQLTLMDDSKLRVTELKKSWRP